MDEEGEEPVHGEDVDEWGLLLPPLQTTQLRVQAGLTHPQNLPKHRHVHRQTTQTPAKVSCK